MAKQIKGVLGKKLGMTQVFDENNRVVPVTVVEAGPCVVTRVRTPERDGYSAIQLGYGRVDPRKANKPLGDYLRKHNITPRRYFAEIRTDDAAEHQIGQESRGDIFQPGPYVDGTVRGKAKGLAGVMTAHGGGR